ncbi:MAG: LysM peptidoglycan-binding domain-containing protein [Chthoniobacterales bacterium]|nr:LysM peptidoglycan-binding domain-containing protein [Chthoniobacterales bacterium]
MIKIIPVKRKEKTIGKYKLEASAARAIGRREEMEEIEEEEEEDYEPPEPTMKLSHAFLVVLLLHLIAVAGVFGFNQMKSRQMAMEKANQEKQIAGQEFKEVGQNGVGVNKGKLINEERESGPLVGEGVKEQQLVGVGGKVQPTSHTVVAGDTLTRIAGKYGVSVEELQRLNGLGSNSILRVGQVLRLPGMSKGSNEVDGVSKTAVASVTNGVGVAEPISGVIPPKQNSGVVSGKGDVSKAQTFQAIERRDEVVSRTNVEAVKPSGSNVENKGEAEGKYRIYEVVAGDNPYKIAKKYKVSYQELLRVNNIDDPRKLRIGQKLKIPEKTAE